MNNKEKPVDNNSHTLDMDCVNAIREFIGLDPLYWTMKKTIEKRKQEEAQCTR